jgi:hypothetical protein
MSNIHDEEAVKHILKILRIGAVSRVDFTPINKKPGFGEKHDDVVKSAFIHFFDTPSGFPFDTPDGFPYDEAFWWEIASGMSCRIPVSKNEYWIFLKNNNPINKTLMNIHQVVENGRHLENLIEEQAKTIEKQADAIKDLSEKLEGVQAVIYQLLGGLFHQEDQRHCARDYVSVLYTGEMRPRSRFEDRDDSKWEQWPTTRQGDECEKRIEALEKMLGVGDHDTALLYKEMYGHLVDSVFVDKEDRMEYVVHSIDWDPPYPAPVIICRKHNDEFQSSSSDICNQRRLTLEYVLECMRAQDD